MKGSDLGAVAKARARLRELAAEHPELTGESSVDAWERTLEANEMAEHEEQIAVRLPGAMMARLDEHVERMKKEHPGMRVTRSDAVRTILAKALAEDQPKPKARR